MLSGLSKDQVIHWPSSKLKDQSKRNKLWEGSIQEGNTNQKGKLEPFSSLFKQELEAFIVRTRIADGLSDGRVILESEDDSTTAVVFQSAV